MTEPLKRFKPNTKMVPVPSRSIIPERDVNHSPVLEASHLGIEFGGLKAVDDVNLAIGRTEICGLIGPNGAGKTTVFNLLTKVYQPTTGTVLINGKDTAGMNTVQASKLGIARTFQNIRLFDNLSVEDNVKLGMHNQINYGMFSGIMRLPSYWKQERIAHERAMELLDMDPSYAERDLNVGFSGGEKKKSEILQLLMLKPSLALLDETDSGLDVDAVRLVSKGVEEYQKDHNGALLIITHSTRILDALSVDYTHVLVNGKIAANGDGSLVEEINVNGYERFEKMAEA